MSVFYEKTSFFSIPHAGMLNRRSLLSSFLCIVLFALFPFCSRNDTKIAIWSGGPQDGIFGFNFCQNQLETGKTDLDEALRKDDYVAASIFASTNKRKFRNLVNSLGLDKDDEITIYVSTGDKLETTTKIEEFSTLRSGSVSAVAMNLISQTAAITSTTNIWSFTDSNGDYHNDNCENADDNSSSKMGRVMRGRVISQASIDCSQTAQIICIGKQ